MDSGPEVESCEPIIPTHAQVLVIGGGPAGSYAASVLAREGMHVVLFEATQFPRYHIGESLLPSVRHYLRFVDAEQKLVKCDFKHKPGAAIKFNQFKREGYTDFMALGHANSSWNVTRAEFDQMLLNHARVVGVHVYERTRVISLHFSNRDSSRPVAATWRQSRRAQTNPEMNHVNFEGEITFDFLVDATGRAGLVSDHHLKNRHYNESLRNVALWGYWTGTEMYGAGTEREGAPWFEALTDDSGWAWFIPLHDGTTSVGVVVNQKLYQDKYNFPGLSGPTTMMRYQALMRLAPNLTRLVGKGTLISKPLSSRRGDSRNPVETLVHSAADFSYSATSYGGDSYRIIGDAGAFIDPLFSSGVHLAMTSALSAAASICASIRGDCTETAAAAWYTKRFTLSYTRFQMVVLSAYEQIRATRFDVLNDVDEDGYDTAFTSIRPVIQGASDIGKRLSESELQNALDFCSKFFSPTSPEQRTQVTRCGIPGRLLDMSIEPLSPVEIDAALSVAGTGIRVEAQIQDDTKMVVEQTNARRLVHREYLVHNLEAEAIDGYIVRLRRGLLGLSKVG